MNDSVCKCFTGRLSRLVNCLNGFDERVNIRIDDKSQIANIIIMIKSKYDDIEQIRIESEKELRERGYDEETIKVWISFIE